ncbi:hypothetical protein A2116_02380 [Candidatus Jorgensenbacteria bacterium GWA1_49_17]|uniref:Uncharacterized protein n=2 Tax=Candidatus Joergenseniibacteriota TaxID=1752739 RepID=A0A1F6BN71_9BACT|nr:MAG: hypothetical protein A2127_02270 [Candidatus Jorgensenbacteria bacterium GWC1_48_12]OGG40511.1 MAG: hypothetical protein A2116_02380 [Candidatus Jorgensenbacteria bacterium GWA1_49_17]
MWLSILAVVLVLAAFFGAYLAGAIMGEMQIVIVPKERAERKSKILFFGGALMLVIGIAILWPAG